MKSTKFLFLLAFLISGLFITSCEKNHDDNEITITIDEPTNGATIATADCGSVHVHLAIDASVENHVVEIVLHPEGDLDDKIIDFDKHTHDKEFKFEQELDLCGYAAGTCFHLEVSACVDHDCNEKSTAEAEFCLE